MHRFFEKNNVFCQSNGKKTDWGCNKSMNTTPININKRWIASLHESIDQLDPNLKLEIMKPVGIGCTLDILSLCKEYNGKEVKTIEELVSGWNMLRNKRNLKGGWKLEKNFVRGIFHECGCPLVRSGLIELHPIQCYCSQGMMESIFSKVAKRLVKVEIRQSIGRGDTVCEFVIIL